MHPGLSADDIYIMVEDEFLSIAQRYTTHLHHAEYTRLKNLAKTRDTDSLTRPVDSITTMRQETRKKKQSEARATNIKSGMEVILTPERARRLAATGGEEGSSESSDFDEKETGHEPWQGTQLQCFMTTSPRKNLAGLTGLSGVVSNTRAAKGYEQAPRSKTPTKKQNPDPAPSLSSGDDSEDDDDDLDGPVRAPPRPTPSPKCKEAHPRAHPSPSRPRPKRSFLDLSPISPNPIAKNSRPQPTVSFETTSPPRASVPSAKTPLYPAAKVEALGPTLRHASTLDIRSRLKMQRERGKLGKEKDAARGGGVDEIPMFLV